MKHNHFLPYHHEGRVESGCANGAKRSAVPMVGYFVCKRRFCISHSPSILLKELFHLRKYDPKPPEEGYTIPYTVLFQSNCQVHGIA